jgi:hypothetical protein
MTGSVRRELHPRRSLWDRFWFDEPHMQLHYYRQSVWHLDRLVLALGGLPN